VYGCDCGLFGKIPHVRSGIVVELERCPRYGVGWKGTSFMGSHARISYGPVLESRHPSAIGATTCPVWNGLLTNYGYYRKHNTHM
jgi:hypothetical protein